MTSKKYFALTVLAISAVLGLWREAAAEYTGAANQFMPTKDAGIWAYPSEQMINSGAAGKIRPLKTNQNVAIMDFDTVAMQAYLDANPGTAVWALSIRPADGMPTDGDIGVQTIESLNDWAEGDGGTGGGNWNWTSGTAAATYFYAQTIHNGGVLEVDDSLPWIDPDSGPYTFTQRAPNNAAYGVPSSVTDSNPTPAFTNSADFLQSDLNDAWLAAGWASVVLDSEIIDAILTEEDNRGLRFGPLINTESSNWRIWDKDQSGGLVTPYLEVTVTPGENDGDYDEDGDVDGNDFLVWQQGGSLNGATAGDLEVWQTNFGNVSANGAVASVPEPGSLLLVLSASLILTLGRRNARRRA